MTSSSIRTRADFDRLLRGGRRVATGPLTVVVAPGADPAAPARLGLAVRARSGAVVRNRIKRRLRAAFARCRAQGVDVLVMCDEASLRVGFQELSDRLCGTVARMAP